MNTNDFSTYQIIAFVIIFLIVASIIYYLKDFLQSEWKKLFPTNELTGESTNSVLSTDLNQNVLKNTTNSVPATLDYSKILDAKHTTGSLMGAEPPTKADPVLEEPASSEQTWCLVGEDMAGRWCIQVQSPKHCEPIRSYKTKNYCEKSSDRPMD